MYPYIIPAVVKLREPPLTALVDIVSAGSCGRHDQCLLLRCSAAAAPPALIAAFMAVENTEGDFLSDQGKWICGCFY